jgi:hypothetical protein
MATEAGNRSDSIIYLTLVDFLIQLIFFGVFLFVAFNQSGTQDEPNWTPEFKKYGVPILEGFGELVSADNVPIFQQLAKFIRNRQDLLDLVDSLKRAGSVKALLDGAKIVQEAGGNEAARKRLGLGRPACLANKAPLMTLVAYDEFIEVTAITEDGRRVFEEINVNIMPGAKLSFDEFTMRFKLLVQQKVSGEPCVHFVRYERATRLEAPRLAVDKIFLIGR